MRILVVIMAVIAAGCSSRDNLQPFVAVAGAYSLMAAGVGPTPSPAPPPEDGCTPGCRCEGTGIERTGDGLSTTDCRCPDGCECKSRKEASVLMPDPVILVNSSTSAGKTSSGGRAQWQAKSIRR